MFVAYLDKIIMEYNKSKNKINFTTFFIIFEMVVCALFFTMILSNDIILPKHDLKKIK